MLRYNVRAASMRDVFSAVYLVNLKRRPDRLAAALAELHKHDWPFREPVIFPAIDGYALPVPATWQNTPGAYGCRQSHVRILEDTILKGEQSVLVMEDDIRLCDDFTQRCREFLQAIPSAWEGIMLGGAHNIQPFHGNPPSVAPGVVRCMSTALTLAYAVRGRLLYDLCVQWAGGTHDHIDQKFATLQSNYHVYAPDPFVITPSGSASDISLGREYKQTLADDPLLNRANLFRRRTLGGTISLPLVVLHEDVDGAQLARNYRIGVATVPPEVATNLVELKRWLAARLPVLQPGASHFAVQLGGARPDLLHLLRLAWEPIVEVRAAEDIAPYLAPL
jgi:hypothetical protein